MLIIYISKVNLKLRVHSHLLKVKGQCMVYIFQSHALLLMLVASE